MKVKVGQLKAELSKYLREVAHGKEPIEVCIREKTVAYLVPSTGDSASQLREHEVMKERMAAVGLSYTPAKQKPGKLPKVGTARDGKKIRNTVPSIRAEKDW